MFQNVLSQKKLYLEMQRIHPKHADRFLELLQTQKRFWSILLLKMQGMTQITLISLITKYIETEKTNTENNSYNMPKPPLPISLLTTQSESSDMAESTSIWLQFPFGFGVMKRKRYWRFLVKLRKITLGESSRSESSRLWVVEFREKEKNKEDQGEEMHGCDLCVVEFREKEKNKED